MKQPVKLFMVIGFAISLIVTVTATPLLAQSCLLLDGRTLKERLDQIVMGGDLSMADDLFEQTSCTESATYADQQQTAQSLCQPIDGRALKEKLDQITMGSDWSTIDELFDQYDSPTCWQQAEEN